MEGKQFPVVWGYPRTVWWLRDKGHGDELEVLVEAKSDRPDAFKALVKDALSPVRENHLAEILGTGAPYARFYVTSDAVHSIDGVVRTALTKLFSAGS